MDPELTRRWMDAGQLPNLAKLAAQGGFYRLETSHNPESPTSWASFATGSNAGKHNIYDFLVRDVKTYMPDLGIVKKSPPEFLFNYLPIKKPVITSIRGGTSFWVTAGQHGVRSSLLTVPITFPPEAVENGELLSGLPAARHPRHHRHLLLFRDRPVAVRRRQHGDGRDPQAPRHGQGRGEDRTGGPAQPRGEGAAARHPREGARR